jgi:hypothetical protein
MFGIEISLFAGGSQIGECGFEQPVGAFTWRSLRFTAGQASVGNDIYRGFSDMSVSP